MTRFVALLRGINVGGNNIIKMADLKACFEANGFTDVVTYIQSGNVVFASKDAAAAKVTTRVEQMLAKAFDYGARVTLRDQKQLQAIVAKAPKGFGTKPDDYRYDVIFLMEGLTPAAALKEIPKKEGVDEGWAGPGALYFSRLIAKATQSRLSKIASLPLYKEVTIRNWNTTTKLLELMKG